MRIDGGVIANSPIRSRTISHPFRTPLSENLSLAIRRRLEKLAKREARTIEAQLERVIEAGLSAAESENARPKRGKRSLAGLLASQRAPTIDDAIATAAKGATA